MNISKSTIYSDKTSNPLELNKKKVEEIYKENGVVLLRNFNFNENNFFEFTKLFSKIFHMMQTEEKKQTKNKLIMLILV